MRKTALLLVLAGAARVNFHAAVAGAPAGAVYLAGHQGERNRQVTLTAPPVITTSSPLPAATVGTAYTVTLAATGGTPPYRWSLSRGALPAGLSLNSTTGGITGVPSMAGSFNFTVGVTDAAQANATKDLNLVVNTAAAGLTITTASLPVGTVGTPYSATLAATGGTPPYRWSLSAGSLPDGLSLNSQTGVISGTPTKPGAFSFTMRVNDSAASQQTATKPLVLPVNLPALPAISFTGLAATAEPRAQVQPQFGLSLAANFPVDVTGQVVLTFASDAAVTGNDPAIQFRTGGRTVDFQFRANTRQAEFTGGSTAFQTGTVAGTITLTVANLLASGVNVTPASPPAATVRISRRAPVIDSASYAAVAGGFEVTIVGYATSREVTQANFRFAAASGATLNPASLDVNLASPFASYYANYGALYGSQFKLRVGFTVEGSMSAVGTVSVSLKNALGDSATASVR